MLAGLLVFFGRQRVDETSLATLMTFPGQTISQPTYVPLPIKIVPQPLCNAPHGSLHLDWICFFFSVVVSISHKETISLLKGENSSSL